MMHCGSHWATLALKHKLISCSIPPRINRRPSTCFLSRFCLFLFPPLCLTLSPQFPPLPPAPCTVEMHSCERAYSKCPCAVHQHLWVCVHWHNGQNERVWVRRIKRTRALSICREIGNSFWAILRYSSHPRDYSDGWDLPLLWSLIIKPALS